VLFAVCCLGGCEGLYIWSNPCMGSCLGALLPVVYGRGTGETGTDFWVLLKHLKVSRLSDHPTDGTWAMWDAQSPLTSLRMWVCLLDLP
jgi:hypothetical protein